MTLILISCLIGIYFLFWSNRITKKWIRRTFIFYSSLFIGVAFAMSVSFTVKHTTILDAAFAQGNSTIVETVKSKTALKKKATRKESVHLKAKAISQLPDLPRGCEVTSLSMLLDYHDIEVKNTKLAKEVKADPTPYKKTKSATKFGNPNRGFVGDMHSFDNPGYGVYHQPIAELAENYAGDDVIDLTGRPFDTVLHQLSQKRPVWVIINVTYKKLADDQFKTWKTPDGPIKITMLEHSVLITGYDQDYVYFNDPLKQRKKAHLSTFKAAWEQMGKQAITIK